MQAVEQPSDSKTLFYTLPLLELRIFDRVIHSAEVLLDSNFRNFF